MASRSQGIGLFTADSIFAVLKAIPETTGTYAEIVRQAQGHGPILSPYTLSRWVTPAAPTSWPARTTRPTRGSPNNTTSYGPNTADPMQTASANSTGRSNIMEQTCECGNDKMLIPDGTLGDTCRDCQDPDGLQRRRERRTLGQQNNWSHRLERASSVTSRARTETTG